ncbi:MAG: DUF2190 family protein [Thermodesulfobacterium sp.]|nr:DUF2190 family protein [Thermodesulfobacterium sp.]
MAKNYVQKGDILTMNVGTGVSAGDPVVEGNLVGVALTDADSNGNAQVLREGVFKLPVTAQNWDGTAYVDEAINVNDELYYDNGTLNKNSNGIFFGYAREAVPAGATAVIKVLIARK